MTSEESERQRRLGHCPRQKVNHAHAVQYEPDKDIIKPPESKAKNREKAIEELSAKVDALTRVVEFLAATKTEEPCQHSPAKQKLKLNSKQYGCPECIKRGASTCNHCFRCGEAGHRAFWCLKHAQPGKVSQPPADAHSCLIDTEVQTDKLAHVKAHRTTVSTTNSEIHANEIVAQLVRK